MTLGCGRVAGGVAKPPPPPAKQNEPVTPRGGERGPGTGPRLAQPCGSTKRLNDMGRRCRLGLTLGSRCVFRTRGKSWAPGAPG